MADYFWLKFLSTSHLISTFGTLVNATTSTTDVTLNLISDVMILKIYY